MCFHLQSGALPTELWRVCVLSPPTMPIVGLEPTTTRLRVWRSTD
ncbi:hypothetical protein PBCV1_a329aL [Paramecium bursaria Chlorella virus 1]|uniref:Uncharacterized protein n=1 Tax=Paramecium bursaria Chlorella virus 1 TaxID=10506 RepID=F8TU19_PBCV1|nr:hypothetical protein PBCV1_a329aL [Paramecium bursaria Chlorella virus 1]AEI70080.1 hypothetical protein [Paramecium bursaria Chlorella virus 1]